METRRVLGFVLVGIFASMGAQFRTTNFTVEAPTPEIAKRIGQWAEYYRKEKAVQWLGKEMPQWPEPCPIKVTVTMNGAGGATSFAFERGQVLGQKMFIEGSVERLVNSVLPHEVTHTVFANYFRCPVPRWADEGGAVLSEDDVERARHDQMVRDKLNAGRAMPLRRLLPLTEYPTYRDGSPDMENTLSLYAEGFSVTDFLVSQSSRPEFLKFIADGMRSGWDEAAKAHFQYENVSALEEAWLAQLRKTKKQRTGTLAGNTEATEAEPTGRVVERRTSPPVQPLSDDPRPTFRGQSPAELDPPNDRYRDRTSRPGYLAEPTPSSSKRTDSSGIRLGAPDSSPIPATLLGPPIPATGTPGYPR